MATKNKRKNKIKNRSVVQFAKSKVQFLSRFFREDGIMDPESYFTYLEGRYGALSLEQYRQLFPELLVTDMLKFQTICLQEGVIPTGFVNFTATEGKKTEEDIHEICLQEVRPVIARRIATLEEYERQQHLALVEQEKLENQTIDEGESADSD